MQRNNSIKQQRNMINIINKRMAEKNVSLAELSREVQIQHQRLKRFLNGESDIHSRNLFNICEYLELELVKKRRRK